MTKDEPTTFGTMSVDEVMERAERQNELISEAVAEIEYLLSDPTYEPAYDKEKLREFVIEFSNPPS